MNTFYSVPADFAIHTSLSDADGRVTTFKIYANSILLDSITGTNLSWTDRSWDLSALPAGKYAIGIWAKDNDGNSNADALRINKQ